MLTTFCVCKEGTTFTYFVCWYHIRAVFDPRGVGHLWGGFSYSCIHNLNLTVNGGRKVLLTNMAKLAKILSESKSDIFVT